MKTNKLAGSGGSTSSIGAGASIGAGSTGGAGTGGGSTSSGGRSFLLSELLKVKVVDAATGKKLGALKDCVIVEFAAIPHMTTLVVKRSFGRPDLLIGAELIEAIGPRRVTVRIDELAKHEKPLPEGSVLLKDFVLDKKVIDLEDREVSVVFDVKLLRIEATRKIYLTDVEFGRRGLYRRLRLGWLADLLGVEEDFVSWSYVQPLPQSLGSFSGDLKLKALKEQIEDMPPVDLADIIEDLDGPQRDAVFGQLDSEEASDTLEEIEPNVQRQIIATLDDRRAAHLIGQMTPPQAADILAVLAWDEKKDILALLDEGDREKITAIMDRQEESILDYATDRYIMLGSDTKIGWVEDHYDTVARDKDVTMYVYVADGEGRLAGVVDVRELLIADNEATLGEVMTDVVVALEPGQTLRDAYELFQRYGFRAVPILDKERKNLGVIVYKDVMGLKHRFVA